MKKKLSSLAPKESTLATLLPEELKLAVEKQMPKWVSEMNSKEDMANATYAAGQEMLLVFEDALIRHFKFGEKELKQLHNEVRDVLMGVKEFEKNGLSILSPGDVGTIAEKVEKQGIAGLMAEIADVRFTKERMNRSGLEYPTLPGSAPFIKALNKKNK